MCKKMCVHNVTGGGLSIQSTTEREALARNAIEKAINLSRKLTKTNTKI